MRSGDFITIRMSRQSVVDLLNGIAALIASDAQKWSKTVSRDED
ncbi:hypothetical protein CLV68_6036 [Actinokineospora cianjurensis]|uniref:Uncharacterized protein n=1 Tax=Actinokineospora cianjurensis TaxID=585224 RepID=A0A421AVC0_9PSEU|nr:hypothetical protein CLV68_6036 [Actinokineospora cianjurensis]